MAVNKNEYKILIMLKENQCTTELKSFTYTKLCNISKLSMSTVRRSIKKFLVLQYVKEGCKQGISKTFYITPNGIEKLKSIM
ncbi:transcriptional regulator [Clostridium botulinum C]|uniref:transcriptional regulator n=1 Tax=Clostridium botulinum TaxID=1491 RepID=UPI001E2B194C|nr:transcriptional regulator [Clostridium botulinum]MCD3217345.1 transcriptional regulator [Clostridium botulinum C]